MHVCVCIHTFSCSALSAADCEVVSLSPGPLPPFFSASFGRAPVVLWGSSLLGGQIEGGWQRVETAAAFLNGI